MKVTYVCPRLADDQALGQRKRRSGLLAALADRGYTVDVVEVAPSSHRLPHLLRFLPLRSADRRSLKATLGNGRLVLIEGLPLALAALPCYPRRSVVVDVCDSWSKLAGVGGGHLRTRVKRMLARGGVTAAAWWARALTYISEDDARQDQPNRGRGMLIVPNGLATELLAGEDLFDVNGPALLLGDWSYPPNQRMLHNALRWAEEGRLSQRAIRIVGPGLDPERLPAHIEYAGWVPDLAAIFRGCSCLLAPLDEGAGVKNKVLEAIAAGLPVIASAEGLSGIAGPLLAASTVVASSEAVNLDMLLHARDLDERRLAARNAAQNLDWISATEHLDRLLQECVQ